VAVPLFCSFHEVHLEPVDVDTLSCTACRQGPTEDHFLKFVMIRRADVYFSVKGRIICRVILFGVQVVRILGIIGRAGGTVGVTSFNPCFDPVLVIPAGFGCNLSFNFRAEGVNIGWIIQ
jgi:hypothetical protein